MKLNKVILKAFLAMVAITGMSSCSSDDDYTATEMPGNAQVYFSNENSYDFLLAENQNMVQVEVTRVKTEGDLTVGIEKVDTTAAGLFSVPATVTFADGQSTATLPVTFNFADLVSDNDYAVTLKLTSETSAYGDAEAKVIVKYAPWSEWQPFGWEFPKGVTSFSEWEAAYEQFATGGYADYTLIAADELPTYTYTQYLTGTYSQPVLYRESMLDNTKAQILLYDWFYGVNLIVEWNKATGTFSVAPQWTGYNHSSYGQVNTTDTYNYWYNLKGDTSITPEDAPCSFDEETGKFTLDLCYFVSAGYFGYGPEYIQLPGYTQLDHSLTLTDEGTFSSSNGLSQVINMIFGADVASVKYAWFAGALTPEDAVAKADAIFAGDIESVETKESGYKVINVGEAGEYYLVAVMYDASGARVGFDAIAFEAVEANVMTWTPAYIGDFTYTQFFANSDGSPYVDGGLTLLQCDQDPTMFKIEHWGFDVDFIFTMDENGTLTVAEQATGYEHQSYGMVYVSDIVTYTGGTSYGTSYYENGVFNFNLVYYVPEGTFAYGVETFTLTGAASAKAQTAMAASKIKKSGIVANGNMTPKRGMKKMNFVKKAEPKNVTLKTGSAR